MVVATFEMVPLRNHVLRMFQTDSHNVYLTKCRVKHDQTHGLSKVADYCDPACPRVDDELIARLKAVHNYGRGLRQTAPEIRLLVHNLRL
jgi:hypothetical protein